MYILKVNLIMIDLKNSLSYIIILNNLHHLIAINHIKVSHTIDENYKSKYFI